MRQDITYVNVGVIGELFIENLYFPYGIRPNFGLTSRLEDARHLNQCDLNVINKYFKGKIEIKTLKMEVLL